MMFFWIITLTPTFIVIPVTFELHFLPPNLRLYSHDICFVDVLDLFIPVIILKTFKCESSVLFGQTQTLLDRSERVLQLPTHLSKLTANG